MKYLLASLIAVGFIGGSQMATAEEQWMRSGDGAGSKMTLPIEIQRDKTPTTTGEIASQHRPVMGAESTQDGRELVKGGAEAISPTID